MDDSIQTTNIYLETGAAEPTAQATDGLYQIVDVAHVRAPVPLAANGRGSSDAGMPMSVISGYSSSYRRRPRGSCSEEDSKGQVRPTWGYELWFGPGPPVYVVSNVPTEIFLLVISPCIVGTVITGCHEESFIVPSARLLL